MVTGRTQENDTSNRPADDGDALTEQEKRDAHYAEGHVTAKHEVEGGQYKDPKAKKGDND